MGILEILIQRVALWVNYSRREPGTIQRAASNRVDVILDSGELLSEVRISSLAPGSNVLPATGSRCLVTWTEKREPVVAAYEYGAQGFVELAPPGAPVARHGDLCEFPVSIVDQFVGVVISPDAIVAAAISGGASTLPPGTTVTFSGLTAPGGIVGSVVSLETVLKA